MKVTPTQGKGRDARDIVRLDKDRLYKDTMEFRDQLANIGALTTHKLKISELVVTQDVGDMRKLPRIDRDGERRRRWIV